MSKPDEKKAMQKERAEVGKRLVEFRTLMGVAERSDFAKIMEVEYFTLLAYESGRAMPNALFYKKLREKYKFADIGYIITGHHTLIEGVDDSEHIPHRRIPVVDHIPPKGFPKGIPKSLILKETFTTNLDNASVFALLVRGNRFLPEAKQGDFLILAPVTKTKSGNLYVVHEEKKDTLELASIHKSLEGFRISPIHHERFPYSVNDPGLVFEVIEIYRNLV